MSRRPELPAKDAAHRALPRPRSATCTKATGPVLPHPAPEGLWSSHSGHPPPPQVAIKIVSTAEASVEFSCKFLPREISSLSATYKHLNVVGRDPKTSWSPPAQPRPAAFPSWDPYARAQPHPETPIQCT